jgi:3-keto-5-aminohexanoate cleavage enzyme
MITVAGIGAELTKEEQPNLPVSPEEIAQDAADCAAEGAAIYHLHVRDEQGRPTMDVGAFRAAQEAIGSTTELIVQFSSGGAVGDDEESRIAPLELRPEMASLTPGTVNFGDEVFWNPLPLVTRFYKRMRELGIVPEFEIFEPGMIEAAGRVARDHGDDHHRHYDFVLGVPGAMPAWPDSIDFLASHLPPGASWSSTGIGRAHLPVATAAIARGGHVRTGLEDVRFFARGELVRCNAQLVRRVAEMAASQGRPIATPQEARQILGLPGGTLNA